MKFRNDLTADFVQSILSYDPETGVLAWKISSGRASIGARAGYVGDYGYRIVRIKGVAYRAARIAWLLMTGEWPPCLVDHEDNDRLSDKWRNLRLASHGQNRSNCVVYSNNKSGLKGAYPDGSHGRWRSSITYDGRSHHLGCFDTAEEAHARYVDEAKKVFGQFSRAA